MEERYKDKLSAALLKISLEGATGDNLVSLVKVILSGATFVGATNSNDRSLLIHLGFTMMLFEKDWNS